MKISNGSRAKKKSLLAAAASLIAAIALADWLTKPYISIGFLYLFPIMLVGALLSRWQIIFLSLVCAFLQEAFSNLPPNEAITRLLMASAGFMGTGLFVSEATRKRELALKHVAEVETQIKLREEAEEQLRVLVESSPAAIVTVDEMGRILLGNDAAQRLFTADGTSIIGHPIAEFLPELRTVVQTQRSQQFRTTLHCRAKRTNGEVFLAAVWFSTYATNLGPRLAAIIVDLSEDLRGREDLSLDHLLKNARILIGAVAHEIRNLCGAVRVVHKNLSRVQCLENNDDFLALGTLIEGLEKLAAMEMGPGFYQALGSVDLQSVLDELRVLIEPSFQEEGIIIHWQQPSSKLPLVYGEQYGVQQVFLNIARNSQRAMRTTPRKELTISVSVRVDSLEIRFEDTGVGISSPERLFVPFQQGADVTGLGLYVSRAILRSFRGDLLYEPRIVGCCFAVVLARAHDATESASA